MIYSTTQSLSDGFFFFAYPGGEWVIAYQADQRRHLQAVIVPLVKEQARGSKILRPPTNTREASGVPRVLDRAFLLKHCYGQEPSDLCVCNVSGKGLQDVSKIW